MQRHNFLAVHLFPYFLVLLALQTKNSARNFSVMNPDTMENVGEKHDKAKKKLYRAITN